MSKISLRDAWAHWERPLGRAAQRLLAFPPFLSWRAKEDGGAEQATAELLSVEELPSEERLEARTAEISPAYAELFRPRPLKDLRLFVEREDACERLEALVERWREGRGCAAALVGPDGGGKTTLLNWLQEQLPGSETGPRLVMRKGIQTEQAMIHFFSEAFALGSQCHSLDELGHSLSMQKRQVVLVDDLQYLLLRTMENQEAVQAFMAVLLATRGRFLWVLGVREWAWARLNDLFGLHRYVTEAIPVPYFEAESLQRSLRLRQEASGLPLLFEDEGEPDAVEENDIEEWKVRQESLAKECFKSIYSVSRGNPSAAFFFWLNRARRESEGVSLRSCPDVDLEFLRTLDNIYLFTLTELLVHGGLTLEEYGEIFQHDPLESRLILDYLEQRRLVRRVTEEASVPTVIYQVNPVFYTPITKTLEATHILY